MTDRFEAVETELAHLRRAVEDMSAVIARQDREIDRLTRQVAALVAREAERQAQAEGAVVIGDERPPHW